MGTATTTKRINLYQLGLELGNPSLEMDGSGDSDEAKTLRAKEVEDAVLEAAVEAHIADFAIVPPPSPTEVANGMLAASILADLADAGIQVSSLPELRGRIAEISAAAAVERATAASTEERLAILERQFDTQSKMVAFLFRRVV